MFTQIKDYLTERTQTLADRARKFGADPMETVREAAVKSAGRVKSFKAPVRAIAHSGQRLATISQNTAQSLIELQSEVITSALTATAARLERAARAESVLELVRDQAEMLKATRERIAGERSRAVDIIKEAGGDVRKVGSQLYGKLVEKEEEELPKARAPRARKAKRAVRKTAA